MDKATGIRSNVITITTGADKYTDAMKFDTGEILVRIVPTTFTTTTWRIQYSADGQTWATVHSESNSNSVIFKHLDKSQYVRCGIAAAGFAGSDSFTMQLVQNLTTKDEKLQG